MTLYRYECEYDKLDEPHTGFCTAADYFDIPIDGDWSDIIFMMENFLDLPNISMENTLSFFTPKGHKKVRKGVRQMARGIAHLNAKIGLWVIEMDAVESQIQYKDRYQVITARCDDVLNQMRHVVYL